MTDIPDGVEVYQLRFYLKGISPMIWRRLQIRSDSTLADLHYAIQIAMNWSNYYLHWFIIYGKHYAVSRHNVAEAHAAESVHLHDLRLRLNGHFLYEYSFFEWWQHEIRLEQRLPVNGRKTYPVCMGGKRCAPEEDWDGAEGFMTRQDHFSVGHIMGRLLEMHETFQQAPHPDEEEADAYRAEVEQFRYWLSADKFDRKTVNQRLTWYTQDDDRWTEGLEAL